MKTDRELLELAAKAAGYQYDSTEPFQIFVHENSFGNNWCEWNPLTDDGDALRLAVKMSKRKDGIAILLSSRFGSSGFATVYTDERHIAGQEYMQVDPAAATRRAIVRVAAAIGEAM